MDYRKANLREEYLKQSVYTASPADLIVMLFDACIKNLKLAEIYLNDNGDVAEAGIRFIKTQEILMELINCLDMAVPLSEQLLSVYEYLLRSVREVNVKKDLTLLPDLLDILTSMRDTWTQVSKAAYRLSPEVSCG
jgi:flagellar secretion chaperone FliS